MPISASSFTMPAGSRQSSGSNFQSPICVQWKKSITIAEIGNASTRADAAIKLDLKDSFGQWHFLRHGPSGVVH